MFEFEELGSILNVAKETKKKKRGHQSHYISKKNEKRILKNKSIIIIIWIEKKNRII